MDRDQGEPEAVWVDQPTKVDAALRSPDLVPPPAPATIGTGPTARLRDTMARFSSGDTHRARRNDVLAAIEVLADFAFSHRAAAMTNVLREADPKLGLPELQFVVPTLVLCEPLGIVAATEALDHVEAIARVIGRGEPADAKSECAVEWLAEQLGGPSLDPATVANISLLYQNYDATAALFSAMAQARRSGSPRTNALMQTARATPSGTTMNISLRAPEHEFGAGPHRCPGQRIAEAIATGMLCACGDSFSDLGTQ